MIKIFESETEFDSRLWRYLDYCPISPVATQLSKYILGTLHHYRELVISSARTEKFSEPRNWFSTRNLSEQINSSDQKAAT